MSKILTYLGLFVIVVGLLIGTYGLWNRPAPTEEFFVGVAIGIIGLLILIISYRTN